MTNELFDKLKQQVNEKYESQRAAILKVIDEKTLNICLRIMRTLFNKDKYEFKIRKDEVLNILENVIDINLNHTKFEYEEHAVEYITTRLYDYFFTCTYSECFLLDMDYNHIVVEKDEEGYVLWDGDSEIYTYIGKNKKIVEFYEPNEEIKNKIQKESE